MFTLTDILAYYLSKVYFLTFYFDFLRDLFLGWQIILILLFIFLSHKKHLFFYYLLIFLLSFLLTGILKASFPSLRPISFYFSEVQFFDSFPSRHTTISFALSLALIFQNFKYGILSLILTFLIAIFSWLSLRHWPLDIFFGFFFGFFVFLISREILYLFYRFYFYKRQKEG